MKAMNLVFRLAAIIFLISGCTPPGGPGPFDTFPAAQTPVLDTLTAQDPTGVPHPPGGFYFSNLVLKFHVPVATVIEVAVDGYIVKEEPSGCGDIGCYTVLSHKEDPSGQDNYVIQIFPPAYKRRAHKLEFELTDVSVNPTLSGAARVSEPLRRLLLEAADINNPDPHSIPGTAEWASVGDGGFLDYIGLSDQSEYALYSAAVDPAGERKTFRDWKVLNGFNPDNDSLDDAYAFFYNAGDLGFGRSMHMKRLPGGGMAYYVSNYFTVEDARRGSNLIATVAMEYSPVTAGGPPITKFFAYKANGDPLPDPDLDGLGGKFLPRLCIICHGGRVPSPFTADVGARFIPFDLASYQYSTTGGYGRSEQEYQFKQLNLGILETNKSAGEQKLMETWYGGAGFPRDTQDSEAVPDNWGGPEVVYREVVKPSCRSCHITRNSPVDFATFKSFSDEGVLIQKLVCKDRKMPQAKTTYQLFWLDTLRLPNSTAPIHEDDLLEQSGLNNWDTSSPCPK